MCWKLRSRESCSATGFQLSPESPSPCAKVGVGRGGRESAMVTNVHEDYSGGMFPPGRNGQHFKGGSHRLR